MAIAKPPAGCRRYNAFPILPIRPLRSVLRGSFVTLVTPGFYLRAVTIVVGSAIRFFLLLPGRRVGLRYRGSVVVDRTYVRHLREISKWSGALARVHDWPRTVASQVAGTRCRF